MAYKVDAFLAGMQKAGTTALHSLLSEHPDIAASRPKEPHVFDDETHTWDAEPAGARPADAALTACFDAKAWAQAACRIEATPIYSFWPPAMARIRAYNPAAKIVLLLRHPAFRAHSHWRMEVARGDETLDFPEAISALGQSRAEAGPLPHRVYSYLDRGLYAPQIRRVLTHFPRAQLLVLRTDALWRDPQSCMDRLTRFLDLVPLICVQAGRYRPPIDTRHLGGLAPQDRRRLEDLFAEDIRQTAALVGIDLSDWLDPAYAEPMPAARGQT